MKKISIDPITRLEGHGKIDIFLNDDGQVENAYLTIPELRGFEKFCEGRPVEEIPRIVPKICGVCPGVHHMASAKTVDDVYKVKVPSAGVKLRRLFYEAHNLHIIVSQNNCPLIEYFPDVEPDTGNEIFWKVFEGEPHAVDGHITPTGNPGLGITLNRDKLAELAHNN